MQTDPASAATPTFFPLVGPGSHEKNVQDKMRHLTDGLLAQSKKLVLVLDIDHTLLHTTKNPHASIAFKKLQLSRDIFMFSLASPSGGADMTYFVKLRPGLMEFLRSMQELYFIVLYTKGLRVYAEKILTIIDPDDSLIQRRIVCREDQPNLADLKTISTLFPCSERSVLIVDDRANIWHNRRNVFQCHKFHFWPVDYATTDEPDLIIDEYIEKQNEILSMGECPLDEKFSLDLMEVRNKDNVLSTILNVLKTVHALYNRIDNAVADARKILSKLRRSVLKNVHIVFSGLFPVGVPASEQHIWCLAKAYGAKCSEHIDSSVTHLVARNPNTEKANFAASLKSISIVSPAWLFDSATHFRRVAEKNFLLDEKSCQIYVRSFTKKVVTVEELLQRVEPKALKVVDINKPKPAESSESKIVESRRSPEKVVKVVKIAGENTNLGKNGVLEAKKAAFSDSETVGTKPSAPKKASEKSNIEVLSPKLNLNVRTEETISKTPFSFPFRRAVLVRDFVRNAIPPSVPPSAQFNIPIWGETSVFSSPQMNGGNGQTGPHKVRVSKQMQFTTFHRQPPPINRFSNDPKILRVTYAPPTIPNPAPNSNNNIVLPIPPPQPKKIEPKRPLTREKNFQKLYKIKSKETDSASGEIDFTVPRAPKTRGGLLSEMLRFKPELDFGSLTEFEKRAAARAGFTENPAKIAPKIARAGFRDMSGSGISGAKKIGGGLIQKKRPGNDNMSGGVFFALPTKRAKNAKNSKGKKNDKTGRCGAVNVPKKKGKAQKGAGKAKKAKKQQYKNKNAAPATPISGDAFDNLLSMHLDDSATNDKVTIDEKEKISDENLDKNHIKTARKAGFEPKRGKDNVPEEGECVE